MEKDETIAIYQQRFETWRYLDGQFWRLVQLVTVILSSAAIFGRAKDDPIEWWYILAIGISLIAIAFSMHQVSKGLQTNQKTLHTVGVHLGDTNLRPTLRKRTSVSFWITCLVGLFGFLLLAYGLYQFICTFLQP